MIKLLRLAILSALFVVQQLSAQPAWIQDSLDFYIRQSMETEHVPGLALAVIKDGKVVLQRCYGVLEAGKPAMVDSNTLFMIGSNTKAYTATAVCMLENERKLSLENKVKKWMPEFRLYDDCVTEMVSIRDLLCHRLGTMTFQGDYTFWGSDLGRKEVIEKMALLKPPYDFRTRFGYCNAAYMTAGEIIPIVSGLSWEDFIRKNIFKPLDMNRARALSEEVPDASNMATAHAYYDSKLMPLDHSNIDNLAPAGSISLSIRDMTHWLLMQMDTGRYHGKQVIPEKVILKTWDANTIISPRTGYAYGLGWFISNQEGKKMLDHTGGVDGFLSASAFIPELRLGVIVLTNTDNNVLFTSVRDQLFQLYTGDEFKNLIKSGTVDWATNQHAEDRRIEIMRDDIQRMQRLISPNLEMYTGTYSNPVYGTLKVVVENGKLMVYPSHHPNSPGTLELMGENKFMCSFKNPTHGIHPMPFTMGEDGKAKSLELKVNNFLEFNTYTFEKI
ncbi:MAG: serine hydrolase [Saprospiraceae bacterium]|nr:serine hydrolase [Saprospiraceae bacterium]MCB9345826.1 serine hydrolase [Lewinellaceae bacterium]